VYDEYRRGFPSRIIRIECEGDLSGHWDPDRMRQAISNLLGNAIQHGTADQPVKLMAGAEGTHLSVSIQNGGSPIPPGEMSKIFEPLIRGSGIENPLKHRSGSIGLGLYIAREIVRSHGGNIDVVSDDESGTIFRIHLPRAPHRTGPPILDEEHIQTM
jgi:signal transduction histidine kinase